jgi:hypothetical protein
VCDAAQVGSITFAFGNHYHYLTCHSFATNSHVFCFLLSFLTLPFFTLPYQEYLPTNKMSWKNLAIVWAPNLARTDFGVAAPGTGGGGSRGGNGRGSGCGGGGGGGGGGAASAAALMAAMPTDMKPLICTSTPSLAPSLDPITGTAQNIHASLRIFFVFIIALKNHYEARRRRRLHLCWL